MNNSIDRIIDTGSGWFSHIYYKKINNAIRKFEYPGLRPEKPDKVVFPPSQLYISKEIYKEIEDTISSATQEFIWAEGVRRPPYTYLVFDNATPGCYELELIIQDKFKMVLANGWENVKGCMYYDCLEERWLENV